MSVWVQSGCADCDGLTAGKCWRHQGLYDVRPAPAEPFFPAPIITRTIREMCNHCWCERSAYKIDHARCCKCRDEMHDQFVRAAKAGNE